MSRREDGTGRRSKEPWAVSPGDWLSGRGQEGRATKTWDRDLLTDPCWDLPDAAVA